MQEIPGGNCDHGHEDGSDPTADGEGESSAGDDTCDDCGAAYEWRLDVDGVQHYDCPHCDA
jgi:hypothetical protein